MRVAMRTRFGYLIFLCVLLAACGDGSQPQERAAPETDLPPESKVMDYEELLQMWPDASTEEATVTPFGEGT